MVGAVPAFDPHPNHSTSPPACGSDSPGTPQPSGLSHVRARPPARGKEQFPLATALTTCRASNVSPRTTGPAKSLGALDQQACPSAWVATQPQRQPQQNRRHAAAATDAQSGQSRPSVICSTPESSSAWPVRRGPPSYGRRPVPILLFRVFGRARSQPVPSSAWRRSGERLSEGYIGTGWAPARANTGRAAPHGPGATGSRRRSDHARPRSA